MSAVRRPSAGDCITRLSDGGYYTAEALAGLFSVSRSTILRFMGELKAAGAPIASRRGLGYRLTEHLSVLNGDEIYGYLSPLAKLRLGRPTVLLSVDSTNRYAMARSRRRPVPAAQWFLAEHQSAGRGRRGRRWQSPYGGSLYLSVLWRFPAMPEEPGMFSPALALACAKSLRALGVADLALKWPNDILWQGRKLAGILIETRGSPRGNSYLVFGLGLNVALPRRAGKLIDQPWADLSQALGDRCPSRNLLAAMMANAAVTVLSGLELGETPAIEAEWPEWDALWGQNVIVEQGGKRHRGRAQGIDAQGRLLLATEAGIEAFTDGETSLRPET